MRLGTIVVITDADATLAAETLGPEAVEVDVRLGHVGVSEEEPQAEDGLGEDIEDGVANDLSIDAGDASTVGNTPDAVKSININVKEKVSIPG